MSIVLPAESADSTKGAVWPTTPMLSRYALAAAGDATGSHSPWNLSHAACSFCHSWLKRLVDFAAHVSQYLPRRRPSNAQLAQMGGFLGVREKECVGGTFLNGAYQAQSRCACCGRFKQRRANDSPCFGQPRGYDDGV